MRRFEIQYEGTMLSDYWSGASWIDWPYRAHIYVDGSMSYRDVLRALHDDDWGADDAGFFDEESQQLVKSAIGGMFAPCPNLDMKWDASIETDEYGEGPQAIFIGRFVDDE